MSTFRHALVTGASAGIGEEFVVQLAARCESILIVARREERLQQLAQRFAGDCDIRVLAADIASLEGQARVVEAIRQGEALDLIVNNAGFSTLGPFAGSDLDAEIQMLRLHQEATLAFTRAALPAMLERGRGHIINVASIGGFAQLPGVATYAASKAFLVSFSRSLLAEVADSGVQVQCLCPGYTRTEIHSRDTFRGFDTSRIPDEMWMESDAVVSESLAALGSERWLVVNGEQNRALAQRALADLSAAVALP